jgi:hypothetical protein
LRGDVDVAPGRKLASRLLWEKPGEHEIRVVILPEVKARGARAMPGFARRFRPTRTTQEWMNELRDGET